MSICFLIPVKIDRPEQEFQIRRCTESIRSLYPTTLIVIVYAPGSRISIPEDEHTRLEENPYFATMGALYLFYTRKYADYAYVIHDSMAILRPLPEPYGSIRFLYYFKQCVRDHHTIMMDVYTDVLPPDDVFQLVQNLSIGCFGCAFLIHHSAIEKLGILDIIPKVKTKHQFEGMERVFAYLAVKHNLLTPDPAICGDIFAPRVNPWAHGIGNLSLDELRRIDFPQPIFKCIASRN
jgi:hypothetical protein